MNKEMLLSNFNDNLVTLESHDKDKLLEKAREKYMKREEQLVDNWEEQVSMLSSLIKINSSYATIIDLSGFIFSKEREKNVIYTTSVVINRNYLNNALNHTYDLRKYFGNIYCGEKVTILRVQRNRYKEAEWFKLDENIHTYGVLQYKEFFNKDMFNTLSSLREKGYKLILIVEGIGLPLLKIIFKTFGVVISSGKNSFKGNLSPTQFNLSRFMLSVFNTSAYKIITQSFYNNNKFVNKPFLDLTEQNLDLFIKSIICDETKIVNFIYPSISKYKRLACEKNLLLMEKDIENVNKYIKLHPGKFVEVNNRNLTNFNSVQSKKGMHTSTKIIPSQNNVINYFKTSPLRDKSARVSQKKFYSSSSTSLSNKKTNKWISYKTFVDSDINLFKKTLFSDNKVKFNYDYALLTKVRKDNKFFTIGNKQLGVCFSSLNDFFIEEVFETIIDRLENLFEEYPKELEYSCDSVLLEFHPVKEVDGRIYRISNKKEAKLKISNESYRLGVSAFNILGGFDIKNTAYPVTLKRKYSTIMLKRKYSTIEQVNMKGFTTDNTELLDFESRFNNKWLISSEKDKVNYKFYDNSEIFITHKNSRSYVIIVDKKDNEIHKRVYNKYANLISYVIDIPMENGNWKRKQKNLNTIFNDKNEIILSEKNMKFLPISNSFYFKNKNNAIANPNIGVIDIETTSDEIPKCYCLGFYTNLDKKPLTFYIGDDLNSTQLVHSCINEMMRYKYRNTTFYAHNLGKFDAVFILKELLNFNKTPEGKENPYIIPEPVTRNSDILKLVIKRKLNNKISSVTILDSYATLSRSLRDLCLDYKIEYNKSYFPYDFTISDNLFYIGNTPDIHYFIDIPKEVYNNLVKENWDLKKEALEYLMLDLQSLYEVLVLVNKTSNLLFDIDLTDSTTVSSLSNKIFLKKYYDSKNRPVPMIKDPIVFEDLHKAYYGGRVEVFNPVIPKDKKVFYYDVNSLYPTASLNDMPGLNCVYFENVKEKLELHNMFGFLHCNIKCSNDLYLGLLPKRTDTSLIFPKGEWSGWYFTEELKLAALHGYEIEINKGYRFDRVSHVFDSFVNDIYKIKSNPRNPSEKNVAKLILNSLIGRFGMKIEKNKTTLISEEKHLELLTTRIFKNSLDLGGMYLDTYVPSVNKEICTNFSKDYYQILNNENVDEKGINPINNVSISTAAAVLSYARIHMLEIMLYILENNGTLYYTDTDSIVTDLELPEYFIDPVKLGKLKLEHVIKEGFFIADKTYCFINEQGELKKISKGVKSSSLDYSDYERMYYSEVVDGRKISSIRNYKDGYVTISNDIVKLNPTSYKKRGRIIKNRKWIGTEILEVKE